MMSCIIAGIMKLLEELDYTYVITPIDKHVSVVKAPPLTEDELVLLKKSIAETCNCECIFENGNIICTKEGEKAIAMIEHVSAVREEVLQYWMTKIAVATAQGKGTASEYVMYLAAIIALHYV